MGWKQDLKKAAQGGLTNKEIKSIAKDYGGVSRSDVRDRATAKGYISAPATSSEPTYNNFTPQWSPADYANAYAGVMQNYQTGQENLAHIQGGYGVQAAQIGANATVSAAGIRGDADKEVARAYADAQKYAATLGLEGVKYGADKESQWRQAVANIEVKGKLDLQPIINAGLERVAGIEAQSARDVAETTGKYSLESMKERTAADKSIGKMQLAGGMYGLLGSIFG